MSEKRSVSTDALETLGMIHEREEKRDAIHLAVEPVTAGQLLYPGKEIRIENGVAVAADRDDSVGIVDPFINGPVRKGQRFWLVVHPRTIQSLRHVWSHPAFADEPAVAKAVPQAAAQVSVPPTQWHRNQYDRPEWTGSEEDTKEKAEEWIQNHADDLGLSYNELMALANDWLRTGDYYVQQGGQSMENNFHSTEFWAHYETVTGVTVEEDKRESFFSCSC